MKYEARVGLELLPRLFPDSTIESSIWFSYVDLNGRGVAELDYLVRTRQGIFYIVECKLTHGPDAAAQLTRMYAPLVEFYYRPPALALLEICKNLKPDPKLLRVLTPDEAKPDGKVYTMQWRP